MASKNGVTDFIDKYNRLTVADQTVLQALSALHEPASAAVAASCLTGAGCRESPLRAFSPQNVATRLAKLVKAGFAAEETLEARGQKTKLWRCRPEAAEIAIRHAVREGRFLQLAKAALTEGRGRDWKNEGGGESPARRLRLAFHAGDWRLAAREISTLSQAEAGAGGALLARLVAMQPDESWRRTAKAEVFVPVLAEALRDAARGPADPGPLEGLARDFLAKSEAAGTAAAPAGGAAQNELGLALVDILVISGRIKDARKVALALPEDIRDAALAPVALAEGESNAADIAEMAIARRRAGAGGRDGLGAGTAAVWQALAIMAGDAPDAIDTMLRRLAGPPAQTHEEAGALSCLRHAFMFMAGQTAVARTIAATPPDARPLTVLCHALSLLRIEPDRLAAASPGIEDAAKRSASAGFRWLAAQLRGTVDAAGETGEDGAAGAESGKPPLLARLFKGDDAWRRGLRALADLADDGGAGADGSPEKRLAWLVGFPADPANPYTPFDIQPVEQTQGKDGEWSKGRNVALKRIFQHAADLGYVSDQDRMLFSTLRYDFDAAGQGYRFDVAAALPHLVGHPNVYRDDSGGARLDVTAGQFELAVTTAGDDCEITMLPALTDFLPAGTGVSATPVTAARLETPTRLRVYALGARERRLAEVVGAGLTVPARGRDEAVRALSGLAGKIRMHSDIPELAGEGEAVDADARPRFHIMPQNPGIKVEVWAHPLGDDGPAYRPGRGGKMLTAELDGRTVRTVRDVAAEKTLADEVVQACPALAGNDDGDLSWRLEDPGDALAFLSETEDLQGRAVLTWPKGGRFRVRRLRGMAGVRVRVSSGSDWFELDGAVQVDEGLVVDMNSILSALHTSQGRFIEIGDGEYLALTTELRRQLGDLEAMGEFHDGRLRLPLLAAGALEGLTDSGADVRADAEWRQLLERRRSLADFTPEIPAGFKGELRAYQLEGYRWLARLSEWGAGACLADDMGLGKTVQALALLERRAGLGPALVVAPTSVCHNWISETARFTPGLRIMPFGEGDRAGQVARLAPGDILITSYSLLRQENDMLAGVNWATVVLDEAQAIKNVAAKRSKAAMALNAGFRLITTGTPIENHLGELWNLFRFINPRLLGSWRKFQERFAIPIERFRDSEAGDRLRRIIRPFILRRTKKQVLDSLPPKTEITLAVELDERERAFYESLRRGALERLDADAEAPEKKRFQILAEIMRLRRACCAPELIAGGTGMPSAKQEEFQATLASLVENGHKALVFSQFVDHLSIIRRHLDKQGYVYQYLDGSTPPRNRKKAVEAFQAGVGDVFLISLKAGGLGLNLTAADYVIHMDPWWNPAVEDQASDRAHRIGQEKPVTVYRLVAAGTIEEKIVQLHRDKRDLADTLLSGADQAAALDMDELMRLLRDD